MKLSVPIPTYGRKAIAGRLLAHLSRQTRRPDLVVVAVADEGHAPPAFDAAFPVKTVLSRAGLTAQRNAAIAHAIDSHDILVFFDDDFLAAGNYLEGVERAFAEHPSWSAVTGHVIADGITGPGLSFDEGLEILKSDAAGVHGDTGPVEEFSAYGCNMGLRSSAIGSLRFDERLPLYGWQEDVDFTSRLRQRGAVMRLPALRGVHLGIKSGRVSGVRFGYSQIANPVYLIRKGSVPLRRGVAQISRNIAANVVKSLWPEPHVDRRGRLRGNLIAAYHLSRGRVEPEHILKL